MNYHHSREYNSCTILLTFISPLTWLNFGVPEKAHLNKNMNNIIRDQHTQCAQWTNSPISLTGGLTYTRWVHVPLQSGWNVAPMSTAFSLSSPLNGFLNPLKENTTPDCMGEKETTEYYGNTNRYHWILTFVLNTRKHNWILPNTMSHIVYRGIVLNSMGYQWILTPLCSYCSRTGLCIMWYKYVP